METKMTTISFDIELAKKIQAGEHPGKIVTEDGRNVRIVCWDRKTERKYKLIVLIDADRFEVISNNSETGESESFTTYNLVLQVPEWKQEYKFEPFQKVLVKDDGDTWRCEFFSHRIEDKISPFVCMGYTYQHCIPYNEETKHLLGTTDNWEG